MGKGGKGKISNDLVAASCAAVLAVYAAGYVRTREAARRFETQARAPRAPLHANGVAPVAVPSAPTRQPAIVTSAPPASEEPAAPATLPRRPRSSRRLTASAPEASRVAASPEPRGGTTTVASAETSPASSGAPPAIAPVPLPEEIASSAPAVAAVSGPPATPVAKWRDGVYTGVGNSAHGDIEARVVIRNGRIVEAGISNCDTRYPCSVIDSIIHQPVERQSPNVDYVSHATESSYAYYFGLEDALKTALDPTATEATDPK